MIISLNPSFESPKNLSTNDIGTCSILYPKYWALLIIINDTLMIISIWNAYPEFLTMSIKLKNRSFLYSLKLPVKSVILGFRKKVAKKFAPRDISFLVTFHPYTP